MGAHSKQTVDIGYATTRDIERNYSRWAVAVGVADMPVGRNGPGLVKASRQDRLGTAIRPDFTDTLVDISTTLGPDAAICSRSVVLSARVGDRVIGGLVARPQLGYVNGLAPFGVTVQMQTLVRLMKLEIVAVEPEYHRKGIGAAMVGFAVEHMQIAHVHLVYGSFPAGRRLEPFYRALGFTVLGVGLAIDVTAVTGAPFSIGTEDDERLFARSLGDGPSVAAVGLGETRLSR